METLSPLKGRMIAEVALNNLASRSLMKIEACESGVRISVCREPCKNSKQARRDEHETRGRRKGRFEGAIGSGANSRAYLIKHCQFWNSAYT